jgi:Ankyrin repeats (many copies)
LFELILAIKRDIPFSKEVSGRNHLVLQQAVGNSYKLMKTNLRSSTYELRLSFGTLRIRLLDYAATLKHREYGARTSMVVKPTHSQILISFLPNFSQFSVLEWSFSRQFQGIKAALQSFNLRPGWSPIFEFCMKGDIRNVRRLIEEGLASPNDVDPDGWTPVHVRSSF